MTQNGNGKGSRDIGMAFNEVLAFISLNINPFYVDVDS